MYDHTGVSQSSCNAAASASGSQFANASSSCTVDQPGYDTITGPAIVNHNTIVNQNGGVHQAPGPAGGTHQAAVYLSPEMWHWAIIGLAASALLAVAIVACILAVRSERTT